MRKLRFVVLLLSATLSVHMALGQELSVESFRPLVNDLTDSDKTLIITTIQSYMIKETIADGNVLRFSVEYIRSISVNSIPIQRALSLTRFKYNHYSCLPFF